MYNDISRVLFVEVIIMPPPVGKGAISVAFVQGLKYLKMSTTHREGRRRGRMSEARSAGVPRRGKVWGGAP